MTTVNIPAFTKSRRWRGNTEGTPERVRTSTRGYSVVARLLLFAETAHSLAARLERIPMALVNAIDQPRFLGCHGRRGRCGFEDFHGEMGTRRAP